MVEIVWRYREVRRLKENNKSQPVASGETGLLNSIENEYAA
jgi:hypothetical protein